jgi:peptidoglycan/xylan/chitin deacetylase (PgdA/CDA1 family)
LFEESANREFNTIARMDFNSFRLKQVLSECRAFGSAYTSMYPNFVFGKNLDEGGTPVFFYHRVQEELFRRHLQHLKTNGYITLNCDELYETIRNPHLADRRKIVLTFDDGLDDLYSVVYPLLREFRLTAVAYIVPGWIGNKGFVTWPQVREMHESGFVDFQSHSMSHSSIFTSPKIVDFFHPHYVRYAPWDIPRVAQANGDFFAQGSLPYGTPIYTWASRLSDSPCYLPDTRVQEFCVSHVAKNGGDRFFEKPGWRSGLRKLAASFIRDTCRTQRYEDDVQQQDSIKSEIELSKQTIENRVSGKIVRHFAFPWHESGDWVRKALRNAGYRTVAGGLSKEHRPLPLGSNGFEVTRVNGDFLPTLPGIGRQNFRRIIIKKTARRLASGMSY